MDTLKRHAFLVGLVACVVVLCGAGLILIYVFERAPTSDMRQKLDSVLKSARDLAKNPLYTDKLVQEITDPKTGELTRQSAEYESLRNFIRDMGAKRKPLIANLFPLSTDTNLRHQFKPEYLAKLDEFSRTLNALVPPYLAARAEPGAPAGDRAEPPPLPAEGYLMLIHPDLTFPRPEWVAKPEPPSLDQCREAQENLWLMEDIVGRIAEMERDLVPSLLKPGEKPNIRVSPVKELIEVRIGAASAALTGTRMPTMTGRYVPTATEAKTQGVNRAPTLSGRWSLPDKKEGNGYVSLGMYKILPWRLVVIVESRFAGELARRLVGTESFLSVDATQERPIVEASFSGTKDWVAPNRATYGDQGVVRMEIVGESLVFQLAGGRITTPPLIKAPEKAPEPKPPEKPAKGPAATASAKAKG